MDEKVTSSVENTDLKTKQCELYYIVINKNVTMCLGKRQKKKLLAVALDNFLHKERKGKKMELTIKV